MSPNETNVLRFRVNLLGRKNTFSLNLASALFGGAITFGFDRERISDYPKVAYLFHIQYTH